MHAAGSRRRYGTAEPGETDLRQFEDVLLAVDDLETAAREPQADIPGVQPAVRVQDLPCLLLVLVVSLEHCRAPYADLAPRNAAPSHHVTTNSV